MTIIFTHIVKFSLHKQERFTSSITSPDDYRHLCLFWKLFKAGKDGVTVSLAISIFMP